MTDKKQWGGQRTPGPDKSLGRPRRHKAHTQRHIRPYVPVETEDEARLIQALPPDERRLRLLTPRPAPAPGGGGEDEG